MQQNRAAARRTEKVDCIGELEDIENVIEFLVSEKSQGSQARRSENGKFI